LWGGWLAEGQSGGGFVANQNARALRKRLTHQEVKLWVRLRELKPLGFHFRRQAPIGPYIVDFVSFRSQLVIEVDGGQHATPAGLEVDRTRDAFLLSQGLRVRRFWNSDIDQNLDGVMESVLLESPTPALRADPPHKGENLLAFLDFLPQFEISSSGLFSVFGPKMPITRMTPVIAAAMSSATASVPPWRKKKPIRRPTKAALTRPHA